MHTFLDDVHRTLTSLIEKGVVRPSHNSPTAFAAVDLEVALEAAFKIQESELREMEVRKQELPELARQQRFHPTDKLTTFKIIKNVKELVATLLPVVTSMKEEWVMVVPESAVLIASQFGINHAAYNFIARGGRVRVLLHDLSYSVIEIVQEMIANGEGVRYLDKRGIKFTIFDRTACMSAINVNMTRVSLDQEMAALWTDDPISAQYLMLTFKIMRGLSVSAEERILELFEKGPPQTDG